MEEEKEETIEDGAELDDLDAAFDQALAILSDANDKVTHVLETMDNPEVVSRGTEVDEDGNILEGDDESESVVEAQTETAGTEPVE